METLVYKPDLKAPDGTTYNDYPLGWKEITEKEFAQSKFWVYRSTMVESRQMYHKTPEGHNDVVKGFTGAVLYWFHDKTGVAMSHDYWGGKIHYYVFGCDHKYTELSQDECGKRGIYHAGRCYHVSECKVCGTISAHDSSD